MADYFYNVHKNAYVKNSGNMKMKVIAGSQRQKSFKNIKKGLKLKN